MLNSLHPLLSPGLVDSIASQYGPPVIARIPPASADGDQTRGLAELLADLATADVVLFPDIWPGDLDAFFRLRLLQVLEQRPPLAGLSVVILASGIQGPPLAGGFARRFQSGWPFARCVFLTEAGDPARLSDHLGVPVAPLGGTAEVVRTNAVAGQKIAVQIQRTWGSCGSTILFENQVEELVAAGFLTIRLFTDPQWRRGATLRSRLDKVLRENSVHAGAHLDAVAVPDGPPYSLSAESPDAAWQKLLAATATCRIHDPIVTQAVGQADCAIANHLDCIGPAVALAPQARLMLAMHEDRGDALRQWALQNDMAEAVAELYSGAAARVQAPLLELPDICTFVSTADMGRLARHCRRAEPVLPRVYPEQRPPAAEPSFDLLLVGAEHGPNILSMRWFLDQVWRPHLEPRGVRVAIVGRAGRHVRHASPLLHFLGFVEDLEAVRSWCRLTVVPDRGGSGISTKMLTTIASGQPLATTSTGLRGLDPAIAGAIPAHDEPGALAADILALIDDPAKLAERRQQVRQARQAASRTTDHAGLVMSVPRPSGHDIRQRQASWARIAVAAPPQDRALADPGPCSFALDTPFPLSGSPLDPRVLLDGWHEPEPWGRWTDGTVASMRIGLAEPADGPLALELDIVPSSIQTNLRIGVDGTMLPLIDPRRGWNAWDLPPEAIAGKTSFVLSLHAGEAVCPAATGDSPDDRVLGIGVAGVRLVRRQPAVFPLNEFIRVSAATVPGKVLLSGWHPPEDWGCWSSKPAASLRLTMPGKPEAMIRLELDIAPSPVRMPLTVSVNNVALPAVFPANGRNRWDLPAEATDKRAELLVRLEVPETVCPARASQSVDTRELGIGLRGFALIPFTPVYASPGVPLKLARPAALEEVLLDGWHPPEGWGTWSRQQAAVLRLMFRNPLSGAFRLELELAAPPGPMRLTPSVNGRALAEIVPVAGCNTWNLPERLTDGQRTLRVELRTSDTWRPADRGHSRDGRSLGVGVRSVALHREAVPVCPIGPPVGMSAELEESGVLQAGWHEQEDWGRWSSGPSAAMLLRFAAPLAGGHVLELDLMPPVLDKYVAISIDGKVLPPLAVVDGTNEWSLPESCTAGRTSLTVHLLIALPARPVDVLDSADDRLLGVGVRGFRFRRAQDRD